MGFFGTLPLRGARPSNLMSQREGDALGVDIYSYEEYFLMVCLWWVGSTTLGRRLRVVTRTLRLCAAHPA